MKCVFIHLYTSLYIFIRTNYHFLQNRIQISIYKQFLITNPMQTSQVIACSKVITLHMLQSRQPTNIYNPHKGIINCVHINHTNKVIASCGQDGRIVLVNAQKPDNEVFQTNLNTGNTSNKTISANCIMFSSNSHYVAVGSSDNLVKIWDMKNHKQVYSTIKSHVGSVNSLAWIKNLYIDKIQGELLASASVLGDIFLHSVKSSNIIETFNTKNQQTINQIKVSESEGHCRMAACTSNGSITLWNLKNLDKDKTPICYFNNGKKSSITSLSFSSFNPVLLATSSMDQNLTFYDVNQKKSVKVISSEQPLTSINFHHDGHTLLAGGMYGGLFVYDLRKPSKPRQKLIGHDSAIKYSVLIKQYQPSNVANMAQSRASKTSSVTSYNSSNTASLKSFKQNEQIRQVKMNNFIDSNRKTEPINVKQRTSVNKVQNFKELQTKKQNIKLSATSQQAVKNSEIKQGMMSKPNPSINSNGYAFHTKPNESQANSNSRVSQAISVPKSINSEVQFKKLNSTTYLPPQTVTYSNNQTQLQKSSYGGNIATGFQANQKYNLIGNDLKDLIEQKFQTLHMELIHQFHLQQKDIKEMICTLLVEDKKKTQKIKELQSQIAKLRGSTY